MSYSKWQEPLKKPTISYIYTMSYTISYVWYTILYFWYTILYIWHTMSFTISYTTSYTKMARTPKKTYDIVHFIRCHIRYRMSKNRYRVRYHTLFIIRYIYVSYTILYVLHTMSNTISVSCVWHMMSYTLSHISVFWQCNCIAKKISPKMAIPCCIWYRMSKTQHRIRYRTFFK